MRYIDLNSDMGESYGVYRYGADTEIISSISSANIACGWHGGDPLVMEASVKLCLEHGVAIGAHPGFHDLMGFGRRNIVCTPQELRCYTLYQLGALSAFVTSQGGRLHHVKAHGNLYNMAAVNYSMARAIAEAVYDFDPQLIFVGLAGSQLCKAGAEVGLQVAEEVFADRGYKADGTLVPRSEPGALFDDPHQAVQRIVQLVEESSLTAVDGTVVKVQGDTVCLHSDTPGAVSFAQAVRQQLQQRGIGVRRVGGG